MSHHFSNTTHLEVHTDLWVHEVEKNLYAVKLHQEPRFRGAGGSLIVPGSRLMSSSIQQMLVDEENLKALVAGRDYKTVQLRLVPADILEVARTRGFSSFEDALYQRYKGEWPGFYDALSTGTMTADDLIFVKTYDHTLYDRRGLPLPTAIHFDYTDGHITEREYDLEKLAAHLLTRNDVVLSGARYAGWHSDRPEKGFKPTKAKEAILRIPSHNAQEGRTHTLNFIWQPSVEDYRKLRAYMMEKRGENGEYSSLWVRPAVFELDLLGVRAAGAARYDTYFPPSED